MRSQKPYKKSDVRKMPVELLVEVHWLAEALPDTEKYNLASPMRRAAVSIPANIAKGAACNTKKEFVHCLRIVKGSLSESDTHPEISRSSEYLSDQQVVRLETHLDRTDSMVSGLIGFERSSHALRITSHEEPKGT